LCAAHKQQKKTKKSSEKDMATPNVNWGKYVGRTIASKGKNDQYFGAARKPGEQTGNKKKVSRLRLDLKENTSRGEGGSYRLGWPHTRFQ